MGAGAGGDPAGVSTMSKLGHVLEQIESYGELRDVCGTRYEKSRLLAPAIGRGLIRVEPRHGRHELTPAGRQRLDAMRAGTPRRSIAMRCGILGCAMGLVVTGLYLGGLRLPFGRTLPDTPTALPSPDTGWAAVPAGDDLKGLLPADRDARAVGRGQPSPAAASGPPAANGDSTGVAAVDHAGQGVPKGAKKVRRAHALVGRRERVGDSGASGFNAPVFGQPNPRRGRSRDSWLGSSTPYRDERYPAAPMR
jgi:hypothetical protein